MSAPTRRDSEFTPPRRACKAVVIINPIAGYGRSAEQIRSHVDLARRVFVAHGIAAEIHETTRAGDATVLAERAVAAGCGLVVAWGGDGTINEAARVLAHSDVALAIVPAGSGNGLAADLRIPFDPRAALELAATGPTRRIDAGQIDDCLFFNIAGIGLDALIAARFAERGLHRRGAIAYLQLTTTELMRYECATYQLTIDEEHFRHEAMFVAIANGRQYGNRLLIAPGARLDDGLLEVVVVERLSLWSIACRLPSVFRGRLRPGRGVSMHAARTLRIRSDSPIPFHVDGEPRVRGHELTVRARPGALHVRAPNAR